MKNDILVSIIIPVYNSVNTIQYCVESLALQEHTEIMLIDDHSQDESLKVCNNLATRYSNVKVFSSEGKGVSAARNTGLKKAHGDIIGFCDSDDYLQDGTISYVITEFEKDKTLDILVVGYSYVHFEDGKSVIDEEKIHSTCIIDNEKLEKLILGDDAILGSVCNKFYRKAVLCDCFFDVTLQYCEDMLFNMQVLSGTQMYKIKVEDRSMYYYVNNRESATKSAARLFDSTGNLKYESAINKILQLNISNAVKRMASYRLVVICIDTLLHYEDLSVENKQVLKEHISNNWREFFKTIANNFSVDSAKYVIKFLLVKLKD